MTNINEVMERLEGSLSRVTDWKSVSDDLKALLSYTKQCMEALEPFAKAGRLFSDKPYSGFVEAIYSPAAGEEYSINGNHLRAAAKALSTQPGERE